MAGFVISVKGKKGPSSVPTPPGRAQFVWGSRPIDLRAPRIKPINTRDYGKQKPVNIGFGNTGLTGES